MFRSFITFLFFLQPMLWAQSYLDFKQDTVYQQYRIEDIVQFRDQFDQKIFKNFSTLDRIRNLGLKVNNELLNSKFSEAVNQDYMLIRAAEYLNDKLEKDYYDRLEKYYEQDSVYYAHNDIYQKDSTAIKKPVEPVFPTKNYTQSLELYDRVIYEFADGEMIDDALYLKAFLLQEMDQGAKSREIFNELIDKFPDSRYTPHALMALAEYYFNPTSERTPEENLEALNRAIILYRKALRYKDSYRYDEALYRLGWANYRLAVEYPEKYTDAIYYFTRVVDDIYKAKELDPLQERSRHEILSEAVQYIGICFYYAEEDKFFQDAIPEMRKYVQTLNKKNKPYTADVMKSLGDVYFAIQQDAKTIESYSDLQDLFPYYKESADIQYRIVEAFRGDDNKYKYRSEARSFAERYKLFEKYNTKSPWYTKLQGLTLENKFEVLSKAEKNAERALSENITLLYQDTQDKEEDKVPVRTDYERLVTYCREYLDHFPITKDAIDIHFSMATILDQKLHRFKEAYEEFYTLSNSYPDADNEKVVNAAINAVIVADTLFAVSGEKNRNFKFDLDAPLDSEPLTVSENRMVEAYENYIKIAPTGTNTAKYLANISAIYYNRKQFAKANRYNKTLLKRFPGMTNKGLARRQILNSYLAKRQFLSAEAVAREIIDDPASSKENVTYAKMRLADAILLNGQTYEKQQKYFIAGLEYRRVAIDAPFEERPDFLNKALMRSGLSFEKVKEYEQAILSYDIIVDNSKKHNPFMRKALINLSVDYQQLKQYHLAAELNEKIHIDYPDSASAKVYLANASVLYEESKSWKDAIRVNNLYSSKFPSDKESKDMLFFNANYYLKLDDLASANKIYEQYASKYPNDPRTVQAFFERGKYYVNSNELDRAKTEFNHAINRHELLARTLKRGNNFYAAEASYQLIQLLENEYQSIAFTWPKTNIDRQIARKRDMLKDINDKYGKLITYGSPRSLEAPFRIAEAYENFAHTYVEQETNPNERRIAYKIQATQRIRNGAANLYEQAINEFKTAFVNTQKISDKLFSVAKPQVSDSLKLKRKDEINLDSIRNITSYYVATSKERVTSLVFTVAKQSEDNVKSALDFKTEYHGKVGSERKDLIARRELLSKNVQLQVNRSIEAYRRNLTTSVELELENKYTEESKRRIVMNNNVLADEYKRLSNEALKQFSIYLDEYKYLIGQPFGRRSKKLKKQYDAISPDLEDFMSYATEFIQLSLNAYKETILKSQEDSIENDLTEYTSLSILNGPLEYSNILKIYADTIKQVYAQFKLVKANRTEANPDDELIFNYEDGMATLDNLLFAVNDNIIAVLDEAYLLAKEMKLPKTSAYNQILKLLINIDPVMYAQDIPRDELIVSTDSTWLVHDGYKEGWTAEAFDESEWKNAFVLERSPALEQMDTLQTSSIWYVDDIRHVTQPDSSNIINLPPFDIDTLDGSRTYYVMDTLNRKQYLTVDETTGFPLAFTPVYGTKNVKLVVDSVESRDILFRKTFTVPGKIYSAKFYGTADGYTDLFLNGREILSFAGERYGDIEEGAVESFGGLFKTGENTFALNTKDDSKPRDGLNFYVRFEVLPKEFTSDSLSKADETLVFAPEAEQQIQQIVKNRIVVQPVSEKYKGRRQKGFVPIKAETPQNRLTRENEN